MSRVTRNRDEFRPRVHMREGGEVGFEERGDRVATGNRIRPREHMTERPRGGDEVAFEERGDRVIEDAVANLELRNDDYENSSPWAARKFRKLRNRAAGFAFRERKEKRLKQLKADLETQASAGPNEAKVPREPIEDPNVLLKDFWKDGIEDLALRKEKHERFSAFGPDRDRRRRDRDAQLAYRGSKEKHLKQLGADLEKLKQLGSDLENLKQLEANLEDLKQLEADLENLEDQTNASYAEAERLCIQIERLHIRRKQIPKDRIEHSQVTQFPHAISVQDATHTEGKKQSVGLVNDPAWSSTPKLLSESPSISPSKLSRSSRECRAPCFQCLAARQPPKSSPVIAPAATADDVLQTSIDSLPSPTSAPSGIEQSEWYTHTNALTPPETPILENNNKALDSFAMTRAVIRKPVNKKEVRDKELQEWHNSQHLDVNYGDTKAAVLATVNDDGSFQQDENQFHELQIPTDPTENAIGSNRSADLCIQPDTRRTKISKSLVDARVLDDSNEQYEEKTDEPAVFRILTKGEIDHYAFKTQEIRETKARILKEALSSRSSDRGLKDLIPVRKKPDLTSAHEEEEPAGHLKGSKQDDRSQIEKKISTGNATSVSENAGNSIQSVTELLRGYQERSHATKTRIANSDLGVREEINSSILSKSAREKMNSSILSFAVFTLIFVPLSFVSSIFYFNGYEQKNEKNVIRVLLSKGFPQLYKNLCKTIVSGALAACVLYVSGSYRKYLAWPLYQILKFFPLHGRPETSSHTLEEFNYTFSAPLRKHAFFKVAKMKWLSRDTRQKLRSLFRSGEEQLSFSEGGDDLYTCRASTAEPMVISFSARLIKIMNTMNIENILDLTKTEHAESPKRKRLHGQCRCGYRFYDDFVELRPMAVAEYGESLVRRLPTSGGRTNPVDQVVHSKGGHEIGPTRSQSSNWSSFISNPMAGIMTIVKDLADKKGSAPPLPQYELEDGGTARPGSSSCNNELLYLLMCIPQHQYATKLLQPQISAIRSDQDFFLLLRNNYRQMRGRIRRLLSLKALRSIKFVQLEMYKSELVDIRRQDDLPPEDKKNEYRYNPVPAEIIPPVGENHMLHLINHPAHAEEDGFILDRIPKKLKERLLVSPSRGTGIGWGIYFIEGWHVSVVTIVAFAVLLAGSLAFLICWSLLKHDLQGASGVAAYIIAFLGLAIGSVQAIFELT